MTDNFYVSFPNHMGANYPIDEDVYLKQDVEDWLKKCLIEAPNYEDWLNSDAEYSFSELYEAWYNAWFSQFEGLKDD